MTISYEQAALPVKKDFTELHTDFWNRLAKAGSWWTGEEKIAIAAETRQARQCEHCKALKKALSPHAVKGEHESISALPKAAIDAIHRVVNDASRLSKTWYDNLMEQGLTPGHYVELVSTVVTVMMIDDFCKGLSLKPHDLPTPIAGEPDNYVPSKIVTDKAWMPWIALDNHDTPEADLWPAGTSVNVLRAPSYAPEEARQINKDATVHYVSLKLLLGVAKNPNCVLSRGEMELIATKVAMLNQCYYCSSSHAGVINAINMVGSESFNIASLKSDSEDSGIPHGDKMLAFAEAMLGDDETKMIETRDALANAIGAEATVEAVAVVSFFQKMVRIADSSGIPLDDAAEAITASVRSELDLDEFKTRKEAAATL